MQWVLVTTTTAPAPGAISGSSSLRSDHLLSSNKRSAELQGLADFLLRFFLVNAERAKYGLQPLVMGDAKLTAAAQQRAEEIATVNSHVRPNGTKWYTVLSEYGVTDAAAGENAAWGNVSPEEVVNAWMNSEGHRANILDPEARAMGVGYYYNSSST